MLLSLPTIKRVLARKALAHPVSGLDLEVCYLTVIRFSVYSIRLLQDCTYKVVHIQILPTPRNPSFCKQKQQKRHRIPQNNLKSLALLKIPCLSVCTLIFFTLETMLIGACSASQMERKKKNTGEQSLPMMGRLPCS